MYLKHKGCHEIEPLRDMTVEVDVDGPLIESG